MTDQIVYLEHANLTVRDLDEAVRFLTTAFPHFRVRGRGANPQGRKWLHIGTDETYFAFNEARVEGEADNDYGKPGINHLGLVVEDATQVETALKNVGYEESFQADPHPHRKRVYFFDADGNEWEFVEYYSNDPAERNDYEL